MTRHHIGRRARLRGRKAIAGVALLGLLVFAPSALATEHHPTGDFAAFKFCPLSNAETDFCTVANTSTGEFSVGKRTVPIKNTITLQGGLHENASGELEFIAAEGAETLSKTPQFVPGGLLDIVAPEFLNKEEKEKFEETINKGITGVTETTELAGPASAIKLNTDNLIFEEGIALQLPVKVKLGNVFLGEKCVIGSEASPIVLKLTTGTTSPPEPNKPIKGSSGTGEFLDEGTLVRLSGGSLVDNSFAAPGAKGCGTIKLFEGIVNEAVDSELGVPSAAGHNTAILGGNLEEALAAAVKASE